MMKFGITTYKKKPFITVSMEMDLDGRQATDIKTITVNGLDFVQEPDLFVPHVSINGYPLKLDSAVLINGKEHAITSYETTPDRDDGSYGALRITLKRKW